MILTAEQERSLASNINASRELRAVTFSANGEYLLSGGRDQNVQVWRVQDGQRVGTIEAKNVLCLAVSKDGKWIAGGTFWGEVFVWDAETYETVWKHCEDYNNISAVDFSPDSTKLVSGSWNGPATIRDVARGEKIRTLQHKEWVTAAKFSSNGDRIVTATHGSVQVWNSKDGHLLVDIPVTVSSGYNNGLVWFNNHIFVVFDNTITQLDASTGSTVSEWPVPDSDVYSCSCIAIPRHGKFIVYSTRRSVTFWDTSTHMQIGLVEHTEHIRSISLSPGDRSLAIGGEHGTITIKSQSRPTVSIVSR